MLAFSEWKALGANNADKQAEIESSMQQMLRELKPDHPKIGKVKVLLGKIQLDHEPEKARECLESALRIYAAAYPHADVDTTEVELLLSKITESQVA